MAVSVAVCRARLLFRFEFPRVFNCSTLVNTCVVNKCGHVRIGQQCREFTVSIALRCREQEKEKEVPSKKLTSSSSSSSSSDSDSDDEDEVTVQFVRGLPQITVPLPSRDERCRFTLKPVSNTVGDFLEMLRKEDKGVDRAVVYALDGSRIASSNTVETLLQHDFRLVINDNTYSVSVPDEIKITNEEVKKLDDVKTLVHQLYEVLNVTDHKVKKEMEMMQELETLQQQLIPLEEVITQQIEAAAHNRCNWLSWAGLGLMSIQFGILARLTWWEYSWDIMEPVTYFVTYGTAMACYAYFVLTKQEYVLPEVKNRQHLIAIHKRAKKMGLNLDEYNRLRDQIHKLESDLKKLRDPRRVPVPINKFTTAGPSMTQSTTTTTTGTTTISPLVDAVVKNLKSPK